MIPLGSLGMAYLRALPQYFKMPLFYVVLLLIASQYRRSSAMEVKLHGRASHSIFRQLVVSTIFGVIGGFIGSVLLLGMGVALSGSWILYVWLAALALAFLSPRLLCFAYGGGIVALLSLIVGWPKIDISSLLGLVALLHAVESVLMYISGHLGAVPVSVKTTTGKIVGGYSLQKFWPVPLLALTVVPGVIPPEVGSISMPGWWPLIIPAGLTASFSFWMIPVVAGLGYGELAIATSPRRRARESAGKLALYSFILFFLAYLSTRHYFFMVMGAIFAPLGHELLVWTTNRQEMEGSPYYTAIPGSVRILDVLPGSVAQRAGLRSGDLVSACQGLPVSSVDDLRNMREQHDGGLELETSRGRVFLREPSKDPLFGIIPVPDNEAGTYLETRFASPLDYVARLFGR